jgi:hypothetical protein
MSNTSDMTEVQRALWLAWLAAERRVVHLTDKRPVRPEFETEVTTDPIEIERRNKAWSDYGDASFNWREDWNQALGFRDGLHEACGLAKVPNFTCDLPIVENVEKKA